MIEECGHLTLEIPNVSVNVASQAVDSGSVLLPKLCLLGFGFYFVDPCGDYGCDCDCDFHCDFALFCVFDLGCDYDLSL